VTTVERRTCAPLKHEAVEQRDAAVEGRLEPCGSTIIGALIVNQDKVVRPPQLIASVRRTHAPRVRTWEQ
jgi:hypothetical protein